MLLPNSVNFTLHWSGSPTDMYLDVRIGVSGLGNLTTPHSLTSESLIFNSTHPWNAEGPALPAIRFLVGWC